MDDNKETLSLEELLSKQKSHQLLTGLMTAIVLSMIIVGIADFFNTKTFKFTQFIALFFMPSLVLFYLKLKNLKKEIASR